MADVDVQVAHASEDGYILFQEDQSGFMGDSSSFVTNSKVVIGRHTGEQLGDSNYHDTYTGWAHFRSLGIPSGATIDDATLQFYHSANNGFDQGGDPGEDFKIEAQNSGQVSKPTAYAHVTGWTLTSADVDTGSLIDASEGGMGPNESFNNDWYPTHASPGAGIEIKTIIQELVNGSWTENDNMNLKFTPAAHNGSFDWDVQWHDYDTSPTSKSMKIAINYTAAAGGGATATPGAFLLFLS